MPVISATWKAEISRIVVSGQPAQAGTTLSMEKCVPDITEQGEAQARSIAVQASPSKKKKKQKKALSPKYQEQKERLAHPPRKCKALTSNTSTDKETNKQKIEAMEKLVTVITKIKLLMIVNLNYL
jgi:hypothetical protein